MGIFDKQKASKQTQPKKTVYSMESRDGQNQVMIFRIEPIGRATHRDKVQTNVYVARIIKYGDEDTIYFDTADYIGFELPVGVDINEQIMQLIMGKYDEEKNKYTQEYYVGRVLEQNNKYSLGYMSQTVENLVYDKFKEIKQKQIERNRKKQEERKQRELDSVKKMRFEAEISAREHMEQMAEARSRRKENPYIKFIGKYRENGLAYYDYDGVDMFSGDILRIRKVNKVGKDGSGTYLYSGYVSSTVNEDDVEFFDLDSYSEYICFELDRRLEDIVSEHNDSEIRAVLTLLSNAKRQKRENDIYIGKVDRNGNIIRNEVSDSNAIRMKVEELKREYEKRLEAKRKERRELQQ